MEPSKLVGEQTKQGLTYHAFSGKALGAYPEIVIALLQMKRAAATTNVKASVISEGQKRRIHEAADYLKKHAHDVSVFVADVYQGGGAIAVNVNINEAIQLYDLQSVAADPLEIKQTINASQSTADVCATAGRIALYRLAQRLEHEVLGARKALLERCKQEFSDAGFRARTCLQDAMFAKIDDFLLGWCAVLEEHAGVLAEMGSHFLKINLGGTVIGSGDGASAEYRFYILDAASEEAGVTLSFVDDFFSSAQFSAPLLRFGGELNNLCSSVAKMCRDLRMLSSGPKDGFGELSLPKLIQGSSFFADKNNPTQPETFMQCACLVEGLYASMRAAATQAELNLNVFEPLIVFNLYEAIELTTKALHHLTTHCFTGLTLGPKGTRHV